MGNPFDRMAKNLDKVVENQKKNEPRLQSVLDNTINSLFVESSNQSLNTHKVWFKDGEAFITSEFERYEKHKQLFTGSEKGCQDYCKENNLVRIYIID